MASSSKTPIWKNWWIQLGKIEPLLFKSCSDYHLFLTLWNLLDGKVLLGAKVGTTLYTFISFRLKDIYKNGVMKYEWLEEGYC